MANYRHTLAAVDIASENAAVIDRALETARQNNARLTLVHVVEFTGTLYAGDIPLPEDLDLDRRLAEQAEDKLKALIAERRLGDIDHVVEIGIPKREIVRIAEEKGADLIVIGSHGRHGLQLLLGSTANGVLHQAKCDVLAVRVSED